MQAARSDQLCDPCCIPPCNQSFQVSEQGIAEMTMAFANLAALTFISGMIAFTRSKHRAAITLLCTAMLLVLAYAWYRASLKSPFWSGGIEAARSMFVAWDYTTLTQYDLIAANFFISLWLAFRESSHLRLFILVFLLWQFGNIVIAAYSLWELYRARGDIILFWMGGHAPATNLDDQSKPSV